MSRSRIDERWRRWTWRTRRSLAALVALLTVGLLAGCAGGGDGGSDDSGGAGDAEAPAVANGSTDGGGVAEDGLGLRESESDQPAGRTAVETRKVISTGEVRLETEDLAKARSELDRLLGRFGGYVSDEQTVNDDEGETSRSVLTVRVGSQYFDDLMGAFEDFSTVTDTTRQAVDVTTEVIDVDARIRTQEVSLQRLRRFLGQASNVDEMIRLESEIAQREADLSSLRAQQKYLDDQTSLATVTVTMSRPDGAEPQEDDPLENAGFLTGLRNGWEALLDILLVFATVTGALLPFAIVLGVLGVPLWVWIRSTRRRRTVAVAGPVADPVAGPPA